MSNVKMRANGADTIECDSCHKRARLSGELSEPRGWYGLIDGRATDEPGSDQMFDFCSLSCISKWHGKQAPAAKEGQGSTANECRCRMCGNPGEYPMNSPCPLGWLIIIFDSDRRKAVLLCKLHCLGLWLAKAARPATALARAAG